MHQGWTLGRNRLLAALPAADLACIEAGLEPVTLHAGEVLRESNVVAPYAYFPTGSVVSIGLMTRDGSSASLAMIGNEGLLNLAPLLGGQSTPSHWHVVASGQALRVPSHILLAEFERGGALTRIVLRYVQALMTQLALTSFCNRHHALEPQLCRWLLMTQDRIATQRVEITQEIIAAMLGVRRETVSIAAHQLQEDGKVQYSRGVLEVLDREALERCACDCYLIERRELDRLVPP